MNTNLHAHLTVTVKDCDGTHITQSLVEQSDKELASKGGYLDFMERVASALVWVFADDGELTVDSNGLIWEERTEEGYRRKNAEWCENTHCLAAAGINR